MSYLDEIWERVDVEHICEFILNDGTKEVYGDNTYRERLENATASMRVRIENCFTDEEEREDTNNDLSFALETYKDVHTEIGMKIGARLVYQLLTVDDSKKEGVEYAKRAKSKNHYEGN